MPEEQGLEALEPWLGGIMARLAPGQQMMLARRVGRLLRMANAARVMANVEPDGTPMQPRKTKTGHARKGQKGIRGKTPIRQRGGKGAMFRRIELARNMVVIPGPGEVVLTFKPRVAETAAVHHFGEVAPVDPRIPNSIRTRYPARRLLGFGAGDSEAILAAAMAFLEGRNLGG